MEDDVKIQKILARLNKGLTNPVWRPVEGYHIIPSIDFKDDDADKGQINLDVGTPVKMFLNTSTGEIRQYWLKHVVRKY